MRKKRVIQSGAVKKRNKQIAKREIVKNIKKTGCSERNSGKGQENRVKKSEVVMPEEGGKMRYNRIVRKREK